MSKYYVVEIPISKKKKVRKVWGTEKPKSKRIKKMGLKPGDVFTNYLLWKHYILSIKGRWVKVK